MNGFGRICVVLLFSITATIVSAQNDNPGPADVAPHPQESDNTQYLQTEPLPLSGAQEVTLGSTESPNFLFPSLRVFQMLETNPAGPGTPAASATAVYGGVILQRDRRRSQTRLRFGGGETFYPSQSRLNSNYENLSVEQTIAWRRWEFLFASELFHSPRTNFGDLEHYTRPAQLIDETGISQLVIPDQSIFTQQLARLSVSSLGEARYRLGSQTSFTASVGFSELRFLVGGLANVNQFTFLTGINHALNARDTVTLAYGHNVFDLHGITHSIDVDFVEAVYGHQLTGKLLFDMSLGPEVLHDAFGSGRHLFVGGHSSLEYKAAKGDLMLTFLRSITAGSGVLLGAQTNTIELSVSRTLSRNWAGSASLGYARNANLENASGEKSEPLLGGYAGLMIARRLSSGASLFFSYNLQRQNLGGPCLIAGCSPGLRRDQIMGGIDLDLRPIHIR